MARLLDFPVANIEMKPLFELREKQAASTTIRSWHVFETPWEVEETHTRGDTVTAAPKPVDPITIVYCVRLITGSTVCSYPRDLGSRPG